MNGRFSRKCDDDNKDKWDNTAEAEQCQNNMEHCLCTCADGIQPQALLLSSQLNSSLEHTAVRVYLLDDAISRHDADEAQHIL